MEDTTIAAVATAAAERLTRTYGDAAGPVDRLTELAADLIRLDWERGERDAARLLANAVRKIGEEIAQTRDEGADIDAKARELFPD